MESISIPIHTIEVLESMESCDAGEILKAIISHYKADQYVFDSLVAETVFKVIRPQLDAHIKEINDLREKRVQAGIKSGEARRKRKRPAQPKQETPKKTIKERKHEFKLQVLKYKSKYDLKLLEDFFIYWSEHGDNDKKMRFEKERTFGIGNRLHTFFKIRQQRQQKQKDDRL